MVDFRKLKVYLENHEKELVHDLQEIIMPRSKTAQRGEDRLLDEGRNKRLPCFGVFVLENIVRIFNRKMDFETS